MEEYKEEHLPDLLPFYYNRLFPYASFTKWLSYGDEKYLAKREISFTLIDDVYLRFLSFSSPNDFISALHTSKPVKIDIGAVYTDTPQLKKVQSGSVLPIAKEVVFDIDMTDYDNVRTCCTGTDICEKCWKFIRLAIKILDSGLRIDFGYKHILWVFSGRRGVHCWICDEEARKLDDRCRGSLVSYFQVSKGGFNQAKTVNLFGHRIHTSIRRAIKLIGEYFTEILIDQDLLGTQEQVNNFLKMFDTSLRESVRNVLKSPKTSVEKWEAFVSWHKNYMQQGAKESKKYLNLVEEIQLQFCYPRLDVHVTKSRNHLLKAPFCIHPKTGKISIPFNPKLVDKFDPHNVPTISLLVKEIHAYDKTTLEQEKENVDEMENKLPYLTKIRDYKKTSLLKSVTLFDDFLRSMELDKMAKLDIN